MRASLEGKVAIRPCHYELWNVSHVNLGWLPIVTSLAAVQPVGSDELRAQALARWQAIPDRKSTRLNSSHLVISYAVFCLKKKKKDEIQRYALTEGMHRS